MSKRIGKLTMGIMVVLLGLSGINFAIGGDVDDVPAKKMNLDNDPNKTFFLIGDLEKKDVPDNGYGLFIIMPGGTGSADFHDWVKRIYKFALSKDYLVAQPVAVKWTEKQTTIWPTKKNRVRKAKFTTEEFVDEVINYVKKNYKVNPKRIFTLTWSSSGPAAYAISLDKKSQVTGSYVVMSVFKTNKLPSLRNAKGHAYYIEHSLEDKICPFMMAKDAHRKLLKNRAKVKFSVYKGGHGWHGNSFGRIKEGVKWLEENAAGADGNGKGKGTADKTEENEDEEEEKDEEPKIPKGAKPVTVLKDGFEKSKNWKKGNPIEGVSSSFSRKAHNGKKSLYIKNIKNSYLPPYFQFSRKIPLKKKKSILAVSAWVKAELLGKAVVNMEFYDNDGKCFAYKWVKYIGPEDGSKLLIDHGWKKYEGVVKVPSGTKKTAVALQMYGPGKIWFDDLVIKEY